MKTIKLSKVEIEGLKRRIRKLHVDSVESETVEPDAEKEEVVTQPYDNVLLQEFTARASGYIEDTDVIGSESDITKRLKLPLKSPPKNPFPSLRSADVYRLKQETEEINKRMPSIVLNGISDFKSLI